MMEKIPEITSAEEFDNQVLQADRPVVVTFYADWCGDCQALCPHIAELAKEFEGRLSFVRVEDSHRDIEEKYNVHLIPDVLVFIDGKVRHRWVNVTTPQGYREAFQAIGSKQPA